MDMAARILDKFRQSLFSVEELAFDLKRNPAIGQLAAARRLDRKARH